MLYSGSSRLQGIWRDVKDAAASCDDSKSFTAILQKRLSTKSFGR